MLNFKLQIFVIAISLLMMGYFVYLIRKEVIELKYSGVWLVVGAAMIVISIQPELVGDLARLFGIGLPVNALYLMAILFTLLIIIILTVAVSKNTLRFTRLTQEIALLKAEIERRSAPPRGARGRRAPRGR